MNWSTRSGGLYVCIYHCVTRFIRDSPSLYRDFPRRRGSGYTHFFLMTDNDIIFYLSSGLLLCFDRCMGRFRGGLGRAFCSCAISREFSL